MGKFSNLFRYLVRLSYIDRLLPYLTSGKGYTDFIVKCIPQNFQYHPGTFRKVCRGGIWYKLDLSEYMEWVIYFDLNVEHREELYALVQPGMVVFDIGGNIGETALNFANRTGSGGRVFCFEPVPKTFQRLNENLSLNNYPWLTVEQLAISDKEETLFINPESFNNSGGIFTMRNKQIDSLSVRAVSLDDFVNNNRINHIDMIKIDVEGFEVNVLKGAIDICRNHKPVLFIEVDEGNLERQGASGKHLYDLLDSYGYKVIWSGNVAEGDNLHHDIVAVSSLQ